MYADVAELQIATASRNCHRCGVEFRVYQNRRICPGCKKPKMRARPQPSKRLTLREKQVIDLVCQARLNKEIAFQLHLSEGTIKTYLHTIFQKIGVSNRTELAVWSLKQQVDAA
jgi:DNA-binding NarL/FixJ family response regulator